MLAKIERHVFRMRNQVLLNYLPVSHEHMGTLIATIKQISTTASTIPRAKAFYSDLLTEI